MQGEPMSTRTKALLMNLAILTGLIFECMRGKPLRIVALTGIFIFAVANFVMMLVAKKQDTVRS